MPEKIIVKLEPCSSKLQEIYAFQSLGAWCQSMDFGGRYLRTMFSDLQSHRSQPIFIVQTSNFTIIFSEVLSTKVIDYIFDFWPGTIFIPILIYIYIKNVKFLSFFDIYWARKKFQGKKSKFCYRAILPNLFTSRMPQTASRYPKNCKTSLKVC